MFNVGIIFLVFNLKCDPVDLVNFFGLKQWEENTSSQPPWKKHGNEPPTWDFYL